jgi:hypothetical protein
VYPLLVAVAVLVLFKLVAATLLSVQLDQDFEVPVQPVCVHEVPEATHVPELQVKVAEPE